MGEVTVNFVARDQPHGGWSLVLVEEGPWEPTSVETNLRHLQDRLYGCLDAILDGLVAKQFPESIRKPIQIRLEAFDLPQREVREFFSSFASAAPKLPDYAAAIRSCKDYPQILFELVMQDTSNAV